MFQVAVLASGSKGNAFLVRTNKTKILVDVGLSGKKLFGLMDKLDLSKDKISAIIISHEHSDHVKGAGVVCRKLKIPLYISKHTYFASKKKINKVDEIHYFNTSEKFIIDDLEILPFQSSHDAVDSHNFILQQENNHEQKLGIITDLGYATKLHNLRLKNVTTILLESNHDPKLLLDGPYPWELKQRVKGRNGHLSNEQAVGLITNIMSPVLKNIILVHLSETNNKPNIAYSTMKNYLDSLKSTIFVCVSSQYEPTKIFDV
ncbi:MAG: MBL fold metallo-hydrolase [Candidatus Cloacimonadota bacterium]|nr:MBL fold metallo-hydrolase [Candidatus Cloacimonadota bacterium]